MTELANSFQETEIGYIPAEWEVASLASIVQEGKETINPANSTDELFDYYSIPDFQATGQPGVENGKNIRSQKLLVEKGTVLFGKLNPRVTKVWEVASDSDRRKIASTEFIPLVPHHEKTTTRFLYFLALSDYLLPRARELVSGSTPSRQRVDTHAFLRLPVPLPSLPEQCAIAHVLSTIQRAIAAQEAVIAAAREVKRALMHRLFTYGPYAEPMPTRETDFGDVPATWKISPLNDCAYVQTGATKGRRFNNQPTIEVPYLRVENVQDGYLDLQEMKNLCIRESELERYSLQDGDVVLTEGGDFDKLGRGFIWQGQIKPCIHQNHIFAVRANGTILLPQFFAYLVQSNYGKRYFLKVAHRTTNLASINSTKLKAFPVLLASLDEQRIISHQLEYIDRKVAAEENRKVILQSLFKSALHQLMTGQVRVPPSPHAPLPKRERGAEPSPLRGEG